MTTGIDADGNDNAPAWGYCQAAGCANVARPYWLPDHDYPDDPDGLYCEEHAHRAGWCWGCGDFWGGIEWFDFESRTGLCEICEPSFLRELVTDDESNAWGGDDSE